GGVVANAWLVGGGDPLLATKAFAAWWDGQPRYAGDPMTDFDALAPALKEAGVTSIPGGIHGDDRRYDAVRSIATWPQSAVADHEVNPISALTLNEGYQAWLAKTVVPADPAAFAAATLSGLLGAQGIAAPAGLDGSSPPTGVVLAQLASAPLSAIVGAMLRSSDNQLAELMVKELGYRDDVGTTAGGLAAIESTDKAIGIPLDGVVMRDGSGLDYGDRSTCATLLDTLNVGFRPQFSSIADGLAVAGQSGTLTFRYRGTPMAGKLRAKSGSTDLAGGLVGYLDLGHPVRFAMLFNGRESDAALFQHEDAIIAAMAPYATSGQ
ncbi:MAG: D-alanyl-D-alanine carboxypeptidase, partial [Acidimicrobiales bacterium]